MGLYHGLKQLTLDELILSLQSDPPDGEDVAVGYYTEVAQHIAQQGAIGTEFLLQYMAKANSDQLRAILYGLSSNSLIPLDFHEQIQSYLYHQDPLIIAEAIDALNRQEISIDLSAIKPLQEHSSPYVRGAILRFISRQYPQQAFLMLVEALSDPDFIVRENAVDELGELGLVEAIPKLQPLLQDSHADVRQATQFAIEMLEAIQPCAG